MAYRNKTYVAFDGKNDIHFYRLMEAWKESEHIDFDFHDAHEVNTALDTSTPDTIRRRLRERFSNTKQVVLLGSSNAREKAKDKSSFLAYEVEVILDLKLPLVIANLDRCRVVASKNIPLEIYESTLSTISVSFQPKIVQHALDHYVHDLLNAKTPGHLQYKESVYTSLGM